MTSQVLSINRKEIIMSTEDVETISDEKTYTGVEKLFDISNNPAIGLMFYGPPIFEGIPMETLINEFKEKMKNKKIISVLDARSKLLKFIAEATPIKDLNLFIKHYLKEYKKDLSYYFKNIDKKEFNNEINFYQKKEILPFLKNYSIEDDYFEDILPSFVTNNKEEINNKLWKSFNEILSLGSVGIIIAGFDDEYHFPSFTHFNIILNNQGKIEIEEIETKLNITKPLIRVYATTIGADLFLNGIDNQIEENLIEILAKNNNLNKKTIKNSINGLKMDFKESIENSIEWLPKKERLELNYTLIYLTALKQKISPNIETVGGNIHSCVLEKDKEFNWIS